MNPHPLSITLETSPRSEDTQLIEQGLTDYNLQFAPPYNRQSLTLLVRAPDQSIVGGLLGDTYWGWLYISTVWIHENYRGQGVGKQLVKQAEEEALRRGCHSVQLNTEGFQALPFYQSLGYTVYGILKDHPVGHDEYYLQKKLNAIP